MAAPEEKKRYVDTKENLATYAGDYKANPVHLDGVGDMSKLIYLEEDNVVHNLTVRYGSNGIYTFVASILIAVNPYELLNIYRTQDMDRYRGKRRAELAREEPHCYAVAEESYQLMTKTGKNQSMVICGESGSGKTETAKVFMRYMAHITGQEGGRSQVEQQFIEANPILEAFGNARTVMNNNSSRFGKFTKVLFAESENKTDRPGIAGSFIETYLLEKSRVVHQERGERNYHIFYQLCKGLPYEMMDALQLRQWQEFHYLNSTPDEGTAIFDIPGVSDAQNFEQTSEAMLSLGITPEAQAEVFQTVAGILHLGNIEFESLDGESVTIAVECKQNMDTAALLFQVDGASLEKRLTTRKLKVGAQVFVKPLKEEEAVYNRDAISKSLYSKLFDWIVVNINKALSAVGSSDHNRWIGILDVFGFESSDWNNSFEQLCINFANERLQQYFNGKVIEDEQAEYLREAIPWTPLEVPNNQDTIDLIAKKPHGIIPTLDSTCVMPKGTDDIFVDNLFRQHKKHNRIKRARTRQLNSKTAKNRAIAERAKTKKRGVRERFNGFTIHHYAGDVCYNADGFLDKNADSTHEDTVNLFNASTSGVVAALLAPPPGEEKKRRRRAFQSVGATFTKQLGSLMTTLADTTPHFVRCINPNQFKQARQFDAEYVRPQLRCGGLIEALRVLKLGFPSRVPYAEIYERYGTAMEAQRGKPMKPQDFCEAVFLAFGCDPLSYQLGLNKVFFRPGKQEWLEDVLGKNPELSPEMAAKIQELMVKKRIKRVRGAVMMLVKLDLLAKKARRLKAFTDCANKLRIIGKFLEKPLSQLKRNRAAQTLQASLLAFKGVRARQKGIQSVHTVQDYFRHMLRRAQIRNWSKDTIAAARNRKDTAAVAIQAFMRHAVRRVTLSSVLATRVAETKQRKAEEAALEAERVRQLEEERKKKAAEEAERLRQEQEARAKAEAEAAAKRAEEEKKRQEDEAQRAAEEQKRREEQRIAEEKERQRQEEEEKARVAAMAEEERKAFEAAQAEKARLEEEAKQQAQAEAKQSNEEKFLAMVAARKAEEEAARLREEEEKRQVEDAKIEAEEAKLLEERERQRKIIEEELAMLDELEKKMSKEAAAEEGTNLPEPPIPPRDASSGYDRKSVDQKKQAASRPSSASTARPPPPSYPIPKHILEKHRKRKEELKRQKQAIAAAKMSPAEVAAQHRQVLLNGAKFLKYGKRGAPHIKHVCMSVLGNIHWSSNPMDPRVKQPSDSYIKLKNIIGVYGGKSTAVFHRKVALKAPDYLCFSVVTKDRTLDLQAVTVGERDQWIRAIDSAVTDQRKGMINFIKGQFRFQQNAPAAPTTTTGEVKTTGRVRSATTQVPSNNTAPPPQTRERVESLAPAPSYTDDLDMLQAGEKLFKHGRLGKPKARWINCSKDKLFWGEHNIATTTSAGYSSFISLADVKDIVKGKTTDVLKRKVASKVPGELCFSLILRSRTLDLQCETEERRDEWVAALQGAVQRAKQAAHTRWLEEKRQNSKASRMNVAEQPFESMPAGRTRAATMGMNPRNAPPRPQQEVGFGSMRPPPVSAIQEDEDDQSLPTAPPSPSALEEDSPDPLDAPVRYTSEGLPVMHVAQPKGFRRSGRRSSVEIMASNMRRNMQRQADLQATKRANTAAAAQAAHNNS